MDLREIVIRDFKNSGGSTRNIHLFYQFFGQDPTTSPVVLVAHSLTGNSQVTGDDGWWKELIGPGKVIDTDTYSILAFNMPGNGVGGQEHLIDNYRDFNLGDIARLYREAIENLGFSRIFAALGGTIGGALLWELAVLKPDLIEHLIPIATDLRATDWVIAQCRVQEAILNNSKDPVKDARMHAMTIYRNPQSLTTKFNRRKRPDSLRFEVENWLEFHGDQLHQRFTLASYRLMNHLLATIDVSEGAEHPWLKVSRIKGDICLIGIDSDLLFLPGEIRSTHETLRQFKENVSYKEISSKHGHDGFLIEYPQLIEILEPIFKARGTHEKNQYSSFRNR